MKKSRPSLNRSFFILALVSITALLGCATSPETAQNLRGGGRLIIVRSATMGEDLAVNLAIDGAHVTNIRLNHTYDAPIAAGAHVLTVVSLPQQNDTPTEMRLVVRRGQTYSFTAAWVAAHLTLLRTAPYSG